MKMTDVVNAISKAIFGSGESKVPDEKSVDLNTVYPETRIGDNSFSSDAKGEVGEGIAQKDFKGFKNGVNPLAPPRRDSGSSVGSGVTDGGSADSLEQLDGEKGNGNSPTRRGSGSAVEEPTVAAAAVNKPNPLQGHGLSQARRDSLGKTAAALGGGLKAQEVSHEPGDVSPTVTKGTSFVKQLEQGRSSPATGVNLG